MDTFTVCTPHVCQYGSDENSAGATSNRARNSLIKSKIARLILPPESFRLKPPSDIYENFEDTAELLLYTYEGTELEKLISNHLCGMVEKYPSTILKHLHSSEWEYFGTMCEKFYMDKTKEVDAMFSFSAPPEYHHNAASLHARATHFLRLINICDFSLDEMKKFITKHPRNMFSAAFVKHLSLKDPDFNFHDLPEEWVESVYGVKLVGAHMHVGEEGMFNF